MQVCPKFSIDQLSLLLYKYENSSLFKIFQNPTFTGVGFNFKSKEIYKSDLLEAYLPTFEGLYTACTDGDRRFYIAA